MEMNALAIAVSPPYRNDALFDPDSAVNRDDCLAPFRRLSSEIRAFGGTCHTLDYYKSSGLTPSDILFLDVPADLDRLRTSYGGSRLHLLIQECEVVVPLNWYENSYDVFDTVFSWSRDLYRRGGKFSKVNFSQELVFRPSSKSFADKRLCTLISGNKKSNHHLELYSARQATIDWFEQHAPSAFDFFGVGWDRVSSSNRYLNKLLKVTPIGRLLARRYQTYRGMVHSKVETLQGYRFCICYENAHSIPGYVTEKVFDAMMAGCVPVYWGAPDIDDYIPPSCYIDRRRYSTMEALVDDLISMSAAQHAEIVASIRRYLASEQAQQFSSGHFAREIAQQVFRGA